MGRLAQLDKLRQLYKLDHIYHISNKTKEYTWWTNLDKQFDWAAPVLQQMLGHGWTSQLLMLLNQSPDQIHIWPGHWLKVHDLLVAKRWKVILPVCVEVK